MAAFISVKCQGSKAASAGSTVASRPMSRGLRRTTPQSGTTGFDLVLFTLLLKMLCYSTDNAKILFKSALGGM